MDHQRLGDQVFHSHARIERAEWILKDNLHVTTQAAQVGVAGVEQVVAVKANAAGSWLDQP